MYVGMPECTYVYMYVCKHTYINVYIHTCLYHTYICPYVNTSHAYIHSIQRYIAYISTYMHAYITSSHTYIHTYIPTYAAFNHSRPCSLSLAVNHPAKKRMTLLQPAGTGLENVGDLVAKVEVVSSPKMGMLILDSRSKHQQQPFT